MSEATSSGYLPMRPIDFFGDVYVQSVEDQHLHLKFNPTTPVSQYIIDFSSLFPLFQPKTIIKLKCGNSFLELTECETWKNARDELNDVDLSKVAGQRQPIPEIIPHISRKRGHHDLEYSSLQIQGTSSHPGIPSTQPLLDTDADAPSKKRRRCSQSVASSSRSNVSSNLPSCSNTTSYIERPLPTGDTLLPDLVRGYPSEEGLSEVGSSSTLNPYQIQAPSVPPFIVQQRTDESVASLSKGKGKAHELEPQPNSGYIPAQPRFDVPALPARVPHASSLSVAPSYKTSSVPRALTSTSSATQNFQPPYTAGIPPLGSSVATANHHSKPQQLPTYSAPLVEKTRPRRGSPEVISLESSPEITPINTLPEYRTSHGIGPASIPISQTWTPDYSLQPTPEFHDAAQPTWTPSGASEAPEGGIPKPGRKRLRKHVESPETRTENPANSGTSQRQGRKRKAETSSGAGRREKLPGELRFTMAGGTLQEVEDDIDQPFRITYQSRV